ncbi:MAG: RDD family protein [Pseudomonadota bacterium]
MSVDMSGLPDPVQNKNFYEGVAPRRFMAWVLDSLIILVLSLIAMVLSFFTLIFVAPFLVFFISAGYRWLLMRENSATLGMRWMHIEIRNGAGERLGDKQALFHSALFSALFFIPILPIIGMILMATNRFGQGLHDLPFGTTAILRPE